MTASKNEASRIVVGVDGSTSSRAALRWAVNQAKLTGGTVDAVIAWQVPASMTGYGWMTPIVPDISFEDVAKQTLEEAIAEVVGSSEVPRVRSLVVPGIAAQVLLEASAEADLLVVGRRGHGEFAEALLGSVSQHCVHHAHCPVLIVHA
jgi:nucleotide-binding universal stress UspA family protein